MAAVPVDTLLLDRNTLSRECLKQLLPPARFVVAAEASSVDEAESFLRERRGFGLVLLDLRATEDLAAAARRLREVSPGTKVVLLADGMDSLRLREAIAGALDGYVCKDRPSAALAEALHLVMLGETVYPCSPDMLMSMLGGRAGRPPGRIGLPNGRGLSQRETEILAALMRGESNKQIARELGITEATVKVHLKGLLRKIKASNRTQAAIWALENGFREDLARAGMAA